MPTEPRSAHRFRDAALLAAFGALAALGTSFHLARPLDVGNRAMKATGTADARAADLRAAEFGDERVVLALLEPRGSAVTGAPDDPEVALWLTRLESDPALRSVDVLPASDATGTLAALTLAPAATADHTVAAEQLERALRDVRSRTPATHRLSLTGQPVGESAIAHALAHEQKRVVPIVVVALALALVLLQRRVVHALATLLPGLLAVGCVGIVERALGLAIDPVSSLVAPTLLTIGVAGAVHLVERHRDLRASGVPAAVAPGRAARELVRPMVLTTLTTIAGFLSLTLQSIPAVRAFGVVAAIGVTLAVVLTLVAVPCWLRLADGGYEPQAASLAYDWRRRTARFARFASLVTAVTALLLTGGTYLGSRVSTDTRPERVLPESHAFRVETARIAERLGGIDTVEVLVPARADAPTPSLLATAALASEIGAHELFDTLPGLPRRAASGSLLATLLVVPSGSAEREAGFAWIEERALARGLDGALVTGPSVRVTRDSQRLVRDLVASIASMLVVVFVALALGFKSLRIACIGLVPNVLPIAALYGGL
jgi:predicted RND superfamily exporter protein